MKKRQKIIPLLALFVVGVVLLTAVIPKRLAADTTACNSQGFTITGADANWCNSTTTPSSVFEDLLELVTARISFDYADSNFTVMLTAVSPAMQAALELVTDRISVEYANANRSETLVYPIDIDDDTTPPTLVGSVTESTSGPTEVHIEWVTDEWADSRVEYGIQSGNYTAVVSDELYKKDHEITLTNLQEGVNYYYKLSSTDLSGNTFQSQEYELTITPETNVYLPLITN